MQIEIKMPSHVNAGLVLFSFFFLSVCFLSVLIVILLLLRIIILLLPRKPIRLNNMKHRHSTHSRQHRQYPPWHNTIALLNTNRKQLPNQRRPRGTAHRTHTDTNPIQRTQNFQAGRRVCEQDGATWETKNHQDQFADHEHKHGGHAYRFGNEHDKRGDGVDYGE